MKYLQKILNYPKRIMLSDPTHMTSITDIVAIIILMSKLWWHKNSKFIITLKGKCKRAANEPLLTKYKKRYLAWGTIWGLMWVCVALKKENIEEYSRDPWDQLIWPNKWIIHKKEPIKNISLNKFCYIKVKKIKKLLKGLFEGPKEH